MPSFQIHVVCSDYDVCNQVEASDLEDARRQGLQAALQIGCEEVAKGACFFGAEVRIDQEGEVLQRFMVGLGQSEPLK